MMFRINNRHIHRGLPGLSGRGDVLTCFRMAAIVLLVWLGGNGMAAASSELSDEQAGVLATVREYALQYSNKLPDYICTQITRRTSTRLPSTPEPLKEIPNIDITPSSDVIEERLSYVGQRESYEVIAVNGKPVKGVSRSQMTGAVSAGEFGSLIHHIFSPAAKTAFTWKRMDTLAGRRVYVFAYNVPQEAGTHVKARLENREIVARYDGLIFVDAEKKAISRITVGVHLPFGFSIRLIRQVVDYTPKTITGTSYTLPSHAEVRIQDDLSEYSNKIDFKNYHKFGTESTLLVGDLLAGPGTTALASQNSPEGANAEPTWAEPPIEITEVHTGPTTATTVADPEHDAAVAGPAEKTPQGPPVTPATRSATEIPTIGLTQSPSPPVKDGTPSKTTVDDPKESFRLRVSTDLVMVPVVVRDPNGQAIGNLTKEDFQLFDQGKPRVITSFTADVKEANRADGGNPESTDQPSGGKAPGNSAPLDFTLFLFDDRNLKAGELAQVKEAAARQIDRLRTTDRVALLTTSDVEISAFTEDREQLREALKKVHLQPQNGPGVTQCPHVSYYMAELMLSGSTEAQQAAAAEASQCLLLDAKHAMSRAMMTAREVVVEGENESRSALQTFKNAVRWISQMPGRRSIILVSPGFYLSSHLQVDVADVVEESIRSEVAINALDARGLYTLNAGGETSGGIGDPTATRIKFGILRDEALVASNVMEEMAAGTGGDFVHNTNDLAGGFKQLATPPTCTYLLGFKPENVKMDGSFHSLKVQLSTKKNLKLQARRGYFAVKR
jgi:VWFA-related protein